MCYTRAIAESLNGDITDYFDASNQYQTDGIAFDRAAQNKLTFGEYEKQLRTTIRTNKYDYENTSEKEYQNI